MGKFRKAIVLVGILAATLCARGQLASSQLNGTVRDTSDATVARATVTLRDIDTNRTYTVVTNENGFYAQASMNPGRYTLSVEAPGFARTVQNGIVLTVGQTAEVDVLLKVAAASDAITVTTEAPPLDTSRTEVSQVIQTAEIQSLPISGRLFTDFALLTPGVATGRSSLQSTVTEFEVTRISFGGQRDLSNLVTIDGADNVNTVTGSQRASPPQESVAEFRVVNNSFGVESGRALGGIVNIVTKSGTNDLHGSAYDYLQNNATDARSLLQVAPQKDVLRQNQFGATLGGPIKKDKTFAFLNYEGQRRAESPTYPTTLLNDFALYNAAKVALGIAPENLNVLKTGDSDDGFVKVDHQLNNANRLSVHYNIYDSRSLNVLVGNTLDGGGIAPPSGGHNAFIRDQALVGTLSSILRPNLVNTFLGQYAHRRYDFPATSGQPTLDIPNTLAFGHNFGVFDFIHESRSEFSDTLALVEGNHVTKAGVDTNFVQDSVLYPGFTPMRIVLPGTNCLVIFANYVKPSANIAQNPADGPCPLPAFANGVPIVFWGSDVGHGTVVPGSLPMPLNTNWANAYPPAEANDFTLGLNHNYFGFFLQDQWHVTKNLNLNYGVRYDFETGLSSIINPDYRGVQPRIGLSYALGSKTILRAGGGLFDDRYNLSFVFVLDNQRPNIIPNENIQSRYNSSNFAYTLNQLTFGPPLPNGQTLLPADAAKNLVLNGQLPPNFITGPAGTTVPAGTGSLDHNSRIPYSEQANLEVDREIGRGLVLDLAYLFVAGHKQARAIDLNVCPPQGHTDAGTSCAPGGTPPAGYPIGKDYFSGPLYTNAGLLYFVDNTGNSNYHGMTLQAIYSFKRYFRLNANYTFSKTIDDGTFVTFVSTPQDNSKRNLERALSNQNVKHRFISNFTASAPQTGLLRNFQFSGIVNAQSARPFTEFVGYDANNDTNPVTDRVGNSQRNSYNGDNLIVADLRLQRAFRFRHEQQVALAVDAFNTFNRPNVDEVTSVYGTYNFCNGVVPLHYKDAASRQIQAVQDTGCPAGGPPVANPLFGTPRTVFNPRQLQFSAKYSF